MSLGSEFINQLRKFERDVSPDKSGGWGVAHKLFGPGDYVEQNNTYHQSQDPNSYGGVYGFDQDIENYDTFTGDDYNSLFWNNYTVVNNADGSERPIAIGYTRNDDGIGRIAAVTDGQYTYDSPALIADYFKKNFSRDADDYTIYGVGEFGRSPKIDRYGGIYYDSRLDGSFIPSKVFGSPFNDVNIQYRWNDPQWDVHDEYQRRKFEKNIRDRDSRFYIPQQPTRDMLVQPVAPWDMPNQWQA